jgi:hypothetical protein
VKRRKLKKKNRKPMFQKPCTVYLSRELGILNPIIRRFGFLYKKILIKKTSFTTIKFISTIVKAYALSVIMFHSMIYPDH